MHKILDNKLFSDIRGNLLKIYDSDDFSFSQVFLTESRTNVFRGFHYYSIENKSKRVLHILEGSLLDILIDLRPQFFGQLYKLELSAEKINTVLIPDYCAHGFLSYSDVKLLYLFEKTHIACYDKVINFRSFNELSCIGKCTISSRDDSAPTLVNEFAFI